MSIAKHFFNLESRASKNGKHIIFFNLNYGYLEQNHFNGTVKYIALRISTKMSVPKDDWDPKNYKVANTKNPYRKDINDKLNQIEKISYDELSFFRNQSKRDPSPHELKELVKVKLGRTEKKTSAIYLTEYIARTVSYKNIKPATAKQYDNLLRHIIQYEENKSTRMILGEITEDIYWDFFKIISNIRKETEGVYLTQTTISKDSKNLIAIFNEAYNNDLDIGFNHKKRGVKIQEKAKSYSTYLTQDELVKILKFNDTSLASLVHARNYILISSLTGLRISDMKHLHGTKPKIEGKGDEQIYCFETKIRKGQKDIESPTITIPILEPVNKILELYSGSFPTFPTEQVINRYIKLLLKHLEINDEVEVTKFYYTGINSKSLSVISRVPKHELFTAHDCRSTFITNLLQLGMHESTIEHITHPKLNPKSNFNRYDKSNALQRAFVFINELKTINSDIYRYEQHRL